MDTLYPSRLQFQSRPLSDSYQPTSVSCLSLISFRQVKKTWARREVKDSLLTGPPAERTPRLTCPTFGLKHQRPGFALLLLSHRAGHHLLPARRAGSLLCSFLDRKRRDRYAVCRLRRRLFHSAALPALADRA